MIRYTNFARFKNSQVGQILLMISMMVIFSDIQAKELPDKSSQILAVGPMIEPDCDQLSKGTIDQSTPIKLAIKQFVPSRQKIDCTGKKRFQVDGNAIYLVLIKYGFSSRPNGDVASHVCAIVDNKQAYLFDGFWNGIENRISSIPRDCPEAADEVVGDAFQMCVKPLPGITHPVMKNKSFLNFLESEYAGTFRFCIPTKENLEKILKN